jgi:hypothetical protein
MPHKTALGHRICNERLRDGTKCQLKWGEHPRKEGKVYHGKNSTKTA